MRPLLACPEQRRIDIRQSRFAAAISKAEVYLRGDCELRGILRGCQKRARMRAFDARSTSRSNSTAAQRYLAHIGGFIAGVILAGPLRPPRRGQWPRDIDQGIPVFALSGIV